MYLRKGELGLANKKLGRLKNSRLLGGLHAGM
jgi:hypothetical protein